MKTLYYYRAPNRREVFGFIPDHWIKDTRYLFYSGDTQSYPIPPDLPASLVAPVEESPERLVYSFTIRLELDREGNQRFPCFVLVDGAKQLADHRRVATFPEAREWAK